MQEPPKRNAAEEKKWPRPAKLQKGEEAMGQPSHIGHAILSGIACITDNLLQHIISNTRHTMTLNFCSCSTRASLKTVSAIENVEDLCTDINGWNDENTFGVSVREGFL